MGYKSLGPEEAEGLHVIASRRHLMNAVEFVRQGDAVQAELQLAASEEELERAELYL